MKRQTGVFMKHFMIWPILVPALASFYDEAACAEPSHLKGVEQMVLAASEGPQAASRGSWNTSDFDDFLQQPSPPQSITVDGTIKEYGSDDLYDNNSDDAE